MRHTLSAPLAEGFSWIEGFTNFERARADSLRPFRLERMRRLAAEMGDPQHAFRIIHAAGSKGKGSTCAFAGSILRHAGYSTGVYASPHVESYAERFMFNGEFLDEDILLSAINDVRATAASVTFSDGSSPTTFELLTLTAFSAFKKAGCRWVVLETGLGGRLDATNIVVPEVSLITSIELEHTRILGSTLREVAAEKGGIIKPGVPVVLGPIEDEAMTELLRIAEQKKSPVFHCGQESIRVTTGQRVHITLPDGRRIDTIPGMPGIHQGQNAALAAWAVHIALEESNPVPSETFDKGIASAALPGRFEIETSALSGGDWIYDAAHTPASVAAAGLTFRSRYPRGGVIIIGVAMDKDIDGIAKALPQGLSALIVTPPGSFKQSDSKRTREVLSRYHSGVELCMDPSVAVQRAETLAATDEPVLVIGSFYLLGIIKEVRRSIEIEKEKP